MSCPVGDLVRKKPRLVVEWVGLLLVLTALALHFLSTYSLSAYSDPGKWYAFGRNFAEEFGRSSHPYGFPFVVAVAIRLVGPFRAFLVNIPILLVFVLLLYRFARLHVDESHDHADLAAMLCGAVSILLLVFFDKEMLRFLVDPFRDPLSFVFMLLACCLLIRFRRTGCRTLWMIALCGACVGFACSTRETSAVILLPMFAYALTVKRCGNRSLPFWRPMAVFLTAVILASVPFMWQNLRASGTLVPAQAVQSTVKAEKVISDDEGSQKEANNHADKAMRKRVAIPGVRRAYFRTTFPETAKVLARHYRIWGIGLLVLGVGLAVRRRNLVLLCISLPAGMLYLLLYGQYNRVVTRYLFVLDLFAIPIMAYAVALCFIGILRRVRDDQMFSRAVLGVSGVTMLLAALLSVRGVEDSGQRFLLSHAESFQRDVNAALPVRSYILAERPVEGLLRCFSGMESKSLTYLVDTRVLRDPSLPEAIRKLMNEKGDLYIAWYTDGYGDYMRGEFDLEPVVVQETDKYGLRRKLRDQERLHIARIVTWSKTNISETVRCPSQGMHMLVVNVGRLSGVQRQSVRLSSHELGVDVSPVDHVNFVAVTTAEPGEASIALRSDAVLPGTLSSTWQELSEPIRMELSGDLFIPHRGRFSESFFREPDQRYPYLIDTGRFMAPTVHPAGAVFLIVNDIGLGSPGRAVVSVKHDGKLVHEETLSQGWHRVTLALQGSEVDSENTPLDWTVAPVGSGRMPLLFRSVRVHRVLPGEFFGVDIGLPGDEVAVAGGLYGPERDGEAHWRWTNGQGRFWWVLAEHDGPADVTVFYSGDRAGNAGGANKPTFRVNGVEVIADLQEAESGSVATRATLTVSREIVKPGLNLLEVFSSTWIPTHEGGTDRRVLGIKVHRVEAGLL